MKTPVVAFFNNKGGVGKTSLVYHLAWMYADLGLRVVAADLDPQANLSAAFLDDERLESFWDKDRDRKTVFGCVEPLKTGTGDIAKPYLVSSEDSPSLLVGDLALSSFEDDLSEQWPKCSIGDERAFRVISAFGRLLQQASVSRQGAGADIIVMDLGPNLGAINRAALVAADYVVVPLSPDLFSLQGLRNLGPTLRKWRKAWKEMLLKKPIGVDLDLPAGSMKPLGYIILQHSVRLDRPVKAYERWIEKIPTVYRRAVLNDPIVSGVSVSADPNCLALLKHYRSLMPMAQEARKPVFHLKPADGAVGGHFQAVQSAYQDFQGLAQTIAERAGISVPAPRIH